MVTSERSPNKGCDSENESGLPAILGTVTTWFEQTQLECSEIARGDLRFVVSLCAVCLSIAKTYCRASACLLDNGFRLPAQALLRVTAEIFVKVLWCVSAESEDEMKARQLRWERSTGTQVLKVLHQLLKTPYLFDDNQVTQLRKQCESVERDMKRNPEIRSMPHVTGEGGLFSLTSGLFGGDNMSAILYGQFCSAVHVDTTILRGTFENVDGSLIIRDDPGDEAHLKANCVNLTYVLLLTFRTAIGLPRTDLDRQYKEVVGFLIGSGA